MMEKLRVGIVGATGLVGQTFISLLEDHPWFKTTALFASPRSKGKTYIEAMEGRWRYAAEMPESVKEMIVMGTDEISEIADQIDFVFCAVDMDKAELVQLEEGIAKLEIPVISNNSAMRWTPDVPMIIPEINPEHSILIDTQRKRLNTRHGFIAVKPNCSIQSYVPALTALLDFEPEEIFVSTYQAVSGSGKTLATADEMRNNVIPYIGGEEEKSEWEPLKIWGKVRSGTIDLARKPIISAQCYRVSVEYGHTAAVSVRFRKDINKEVILERWTEYQGHESVRDLPSAPEKFLDYLTEDNRPQPLPDAMAGKGMGITIGRLRKDPIFDYKFTCLSHNLIRGAAGGAVLTAELLYKQGYLTEA
ncbi:MAG: aspartate-semialdehyde dehydrogenase [Clostridiaceae bacterium]|nr:aspartate-semialdehyde dehydrogenase [Clostridiaceae bacterium]